MADSFYAWGANCVAGTSCPALSAGYRIDGTIRHVIEEYDAMASHYPQSDEYDDYVLQGVIERIDAQHAWLEAIEKYNERLQDEYDTATMNRLHSAAIIYREEWGDTLP